MSRNCTHVDVQGSLQYRGPVDVMRQVMKGEGGMMGLYKGLLPTMVREVAGCSAMFAAYEAIKLGVVKQQVPAAALHWHVPCLLSGKLYKHKMAHLLQKQGEVDVEVYRTCQ